ncbi:MAG: DUF748 domain-containing protein [Amphritea sp.]
MSLKGFFNKLIVVLIGLFLLLHTSVYLARDAAVQWLLDQGAESAEIRHLGINWISGKIELSGVRITTPDQPTLRLDQLLVDLDNAELLNKRILISELSLVGVDIDLLQIQSEQGEQLFLGPINLTPQEQTETDQSTESAPSEWLFGLDKLSISDVNWQARLPGQTHHLEISDGLIQHFYMWREQEFTQLKLQGAINGGRFDLDTQAKPLPETKSSELTIKLDALPLHSFTQTFLPGFKATLSTELVISAQMSGETGSIIPRGSIQIADLAWNDGTLQLGQENIRWEGEVDIAIHDGAAEKVAVQGVLQIDDLGLKDGALQLDQEKIRWEGEVGIKFQDGAAENVVAQGALQVDALALKDEALQLDQEKIRWDGEVGIKFQGGAAENIVAQGALQVDALALKDEALQLDQEKIRWEGEVGINFQGGAAEEVVARGALSGHGSKLLLPQKLKVLLGSLGWQGQVTVNPAAEQLGLSLQAAVLTLSGIDVTAVKDDIQLVQLQQLSVDDMALAVPGAIDIGALNADGGVIAGADSGELTGFKQLAIKDLHIEPDALVRIQSVTLQDSLTREVLSAEGNPVNVNRLLAALESLSSADGAAQSAESVEENTTQAKAETESSDANKPLRFQLAELKLLGDNRVYFEDRGTKPAFTTEIKIDQALLQKVDTASQQLSPFSVQLRLDKFTKLYLSGETNLIGGGENANWEGELEQLDIPRLSPYSIGYTGYFVNSGQLHLSTKGELVEGKIEGNNHIKIHRLEVDVADQDQMDKFSRQLSMPLGAAVMILQDGDDNIDLDVPVSGSLDDPDFGLQSIVQNLAGKGLKQAAFSFLTKSLQPYGALISLASSAVDAANKGTFITLQPVGFAPGRAELNAEAADYLLKIATMMQDRKAMRLNICGQVVLQDQLLMEPLLAQENAAREEPLEPEALAETLNKQLLALAQQRSDTIKQQLISSLPGERLFSCFPMPNLESAEALPVATLGL